MNYIIYSETFFGEMMVGRYTQHMQKRVEIYTQIPNLGSRWSFPFISLSKALHRTLTVNLDRLAILPGISNSYRAIWTWWTKLQRYHVCKLVSGLMRVLSRLGFIEEWIFICWNIEWPMWEESKKTNLHKKPNRNSSMWTPRKPIRWPSPPNEIWNVIRYI